MEVQLLINTRTPTCIFFLVPYVNIHRHWYITLPPPPLNFDIHERSRHSTFLDGEPTHRLDKLETSQQGGASVFSLFVVLACLAVVSIDDYQTHRHSSHNPVCLTDTGLPAGKVKSEQDQRRWMPLRAALIVQTSQGTNLSTPLGRNSLDFLVIMLKIRFCLLTNSNRLPPCN